jgi:LuxR family maltose regulon positive regulatory protein
MLLATWFNDLAAQGVAASWVTVDARSSSFADLQALVGQSISAHRCRSSRRDRDARRSPLDAVEPANRILFVDDTHVLDHRVVEELLAWVDGASGQPWRLVLAGRTALHLATPTAPQKAIRSVGPAELRLTDHQVSASLRLHSPSVTLPQERALISSIDGWAAGIGLAYESTGTRRDGVVEPLTGSRPVVADYFAREVFDDLAPSDQGFLTWSSVLAEPSIEGCDELNRDGNSAPRLARLATLNAFVTTCSTSSSGYRWCPLAQEFLLDRLRQQGTEVETKLRRGLLRWCVEQRDYEGAVAQAAVVEAWDAIADIAIDAGPQIIVAGRAKNLLGWLERLPRDVTANASGAAVMAAMALWVTEGDRQAAKLDDWLDRAAKERGGRAPTHAASLAGAIDIGHAAFGRQSPRTRRLLAERALRLDSESETAWTALAHAALGMAAYLDNEPRLARRSLTKSLQVQSKLDVETRRWISRLISPCVLGVLALVELAAGGDITKAAALIAAAELQSHGASPPGSEIVELARSRWALAEGDREAALELSLQAANDGRLTAYRALGLLDAASIYCERGDTARSAACLDEAGQLLDGSPDQGRLLATRRRASERQVQLGRAARANSADTAGVLSDREVEVLRLLDTELSRREIAAELYISFETVKTYVQRLYQKLGVSSRPAAVATAHAWGWLSPEDSLGTS